MVSPQLLRGISGGTSANRSRQHPDFVLKIRGVSYCRGVVERVFSRNPPCPAFGCHFTLGPGYWLGLTGATLSLLGRSWIVLPKSAGGRKVLGSIMFPAGVILAILGVMLPYNLLNEFGPTVVRSPVFIFTGFLLSGVGLNLLFRLESTNTSRIRRALQKPLW